MDRILKNNEGIEIIFNKVGGLKQILFSGVSLVDDNADKNILEISINDTIYTQEKDFKLISYDECKESVLNIKYSILDNIELTLFLSLEATVLTAKAGIKYSGDEKHTVDFVSFIFPGIRIKGKASDIFNAPGQGSCFEITSDNINFRPNIPVVDLAAFETKEDMFSTTPDKGAGLFIIYNDGIAVSAYPYSVRENFFPMTSINGDGVNLIYRNMVCFRADRFREMVTGCVYLYFGENIDACLNNYRAFLVEDIKITALKPPAWVKAGAILEMHINQIGDFEKGIAHLDEFKEMGIKTIYLLPCLLYPNFLKEGRYIHGFRDAGSPYSVIDYYTIDPLSGGEVAFRKFVGAAHSRGLKILFDLVPQGASAYGQLFEEKPHWFCRNREGELFCSHGWQSTYSLDWANPEVTEFFVDMASFYVKEFDIDGFRIDAPHWKEPNMAEDLPYHASYTCFGSIRLVDRILERVKAIKEDVFFLCELWGACYQHQTHAQCEYNIHWMLYNVAQGNYTGRDMQQWYRMYEYTQAPKSIKATFLETHDTALLTPPGEALRGSKVTEVLFNASMFLGHVPMIWYSELEYRSSYYKHMLGLRNSQVEYLDEPVSVDKVLADNENVFTAARNVGKRLLFLANFYRAHIKTRISESGFFGLNPEKRYKFKNLYTGKDFVFYKKGTDGLLYEYVEFLGSELEALEFGLFSFTTYWLELVEVGDKNGLR